MPADNFRQFQTPFSSLKCLSLKAFWGAPWLDTLRGKPIVDAFVDWDRALLCTTCNRTLTPESSLRQLPFFSADDTSARLDCWPVGGGAYSLCGYRYFVTTSQWRPGKGVCGGKCTHILGNEKGELYNGFGVPASDSFHIFDSFVLRSFKQSW